jgi:hypothetical protein
MPRCTSCSLGLAFKLTRAVQLLNQRRLTATCVWGGGALKQLLFIRITCCLLEM